MLYAAVLLLILSAGFTGLCLVTAARSNSLNCYILFYVVALFLSVICAVLTRKVSKTLWAFTLSWFVFLLLSVFFTFDLYITPTFFFSLVIVLTVLWSYIVYFSLFCSQHRYSVVGWLGIFIVLNLLTGWAAWFSGDKILSKRHARNLLICRQKAMQIVEQIKQFKQTNGTFPQTLDELYLEPELTELPLSEFQYDSITDFYFSLTFNDPLFNSIHWPGRYAYEYLKYHDKFRDGWYPDPLDTIGRLDTSIVPKKQDPTDNKTQTVQSRPMMESP
jgi:hypothetical protein